MLKCLMLISCDKLSDRQIADSYGSASLFLFQLVSNFACNGSRGAPKVFKVGVPEELT